jgi:hypothetical protein
MDARRIGDQKMGVDELTDVILIDDNGKVNGY